MNSHPPPCLERERVEGTGAPVSGSAPGYFAGQVREILEGIYGSESGRILAALIRNLGEFDSADDALQDAFAVAAERWPREGIPSNPRAWLISTGRYKTVDVSRRCARLPDHAPHARPAHRAGEGEDPRGASASRENIRIARRF